MKGELVEYPGMYPDETWIEAKASRKSWDGVSGEEGKNPRLGYRDPTGDIQVHLLILGYYQDILWAHLRAFHQQAVTLVCLGEYAPG